MTATTTLGWMGGSLDPGAYRVETHEQDPALSAYLRRVKGLYTDIEQWLAGSTWQVTQEPVTLREARHGDYEAPLLRIQDAQGEELARCVPYGEAILGAWGRVDLTGWRSRRQLLYLTGGGPTLMSSLRLGDSAIKPAARPMLRAVAANGWYWVPPPPVTAARLLDRALLVKLLEDVSGQRCGD